MKRKGPVKARGGHWIKADLAKQAPNNSGERSPGFDTILKVVQALGLRLHAEAKRA